MTPLKISFLKILFIFKNVSIVQNLCRYMFKCINRLYVVFSMLVDFSVNVHFLHPFFFLLLRLDNFNCPSWLLLSSACSDLLFNPYVALAFLGEAGSSCPDNASGCIPCVFTGHVVSSPFPRHSHFFWAVLRGPAHCTAPAHHRLPLGSSPASARSYPPSWYRHVQLPSRMTFCGKMGKEIQLSSCHICLENIKAVCVS